MCCGKYCLHVITDLLLTLRIEIFDGQDHYHRRDARVCNASCALTTRKAFFFWYCYCPKQVRLKAFRTFDECEMRFRVNHTIMHLSLIVECNFFILYYIRLMSLTKCETRCRVEWKSDQQQLILPFCHSHWDSIRTRVLCIFGLTEVQYSFFIDLQLTGMIMAIGSVMILHFY